MNESPVGVALIGTGMWGNRLAEAIARTPSVDLVTCYRRNKEQRDAFAERYGVEPARFFEAAIEHPDVAGVLLITPNQVHAQQALAVAERGKHLFIEKPIADTVADGQLIKDAAEAARVSVLVGHAFRRLGAAVARVPRATRPTLPR